MATPLDPRDAEFVDTVVGAVIGLMWATRRGDRMRFIGELHTLLATIVEHDATLGEHPHNEALRRAVAALNPR